MYTQHKHYCLFLKKMHLPFHEEEASHFLVIVVSVKRVSPSGAILGSRLYLLGNLAACKITHNHFHEDMLCTLRGTMKEGVLWKADIGLSAHFSLFIVLETIEKTERCVRRRKEWQTV